MQASAQKVEGSPRIVSARFIDTHMENVVSVSVVVPVDLDVVLTVVVSVDNVVVVAVSVVTVVVVCDSVVTVAVSVEVMFSAQIPHVVSHRCRNSQ